MSSIHQLHEQHDDPKCNSYAANIAGKAFGLFPEVKKQKYRAGKYRQPDHVGLYKCRLLQINVLQSAQYNQAICSGNAVDAIHKVVHVDNADHENVQQYTNVPGLDMEHFKIEKHQGYGYNMKQQPQPARQCKNIIQETYQADYENTANR